MAKHLYIANDYGKVQLTDEASSYFFLKEVVPLSKYYWNTSEKCSCTWADGKQTTVAYNYCVNHAIDAKLIFVLRNASDTPVRLAVAPLDFAGNPSFHVSVTNCTQEQADALQVFIFSGDVNDFTDNKYGMAFYDAAGKPLYNSSWRPLKIVGYGSKNGAWDAELPYGATCGAILSSGFRLANANTITTGTWTTLTTNTTVSAPSYVMDGSSMSFSPPMFIGGTGTHGEYQNTGEAINTFPVDITYQGYELSKEHLVAIPYTAFAPIATQEGNRSWSEQKPEYQMVRRWSECATEKTEWDPCAEKRFVWDNCASKDFFTGECKAGMVEKCFDGMVKKCTPGWKDEWEWVTITINYNEKTKVTAPYMDNPSLMYGMEAYPDGSVFTRSSGISTAGIVDLTNYL